LILKRCPLCSRLSLALDWLKTLLSTPTASNKQVIAAFDDEALDLVSRCQQINESTIEDSHRVKAFGKECPDCLCEKFTTSPFSPGLIQDTERLTRFVFSPVHLDKKGKKIKPSVFSHVFTVGCSIQRESIVSDDELVNFVARYLTKNAAHAWHGVLTADCAILRGITLDDQSKRIICVYDMAEEVNPAHGEIHQSHYEIEEADQPELRAKLFAAFNNGVNIEPTQYRNGSLRGVLSLNHRNSE
jgi:hypothetical protein